MKRKCKCNGMRDPNLQTMAAALGNARRFGDVEDGERYNSRRRGLVWVEDGKANREAISLAFGYRRKECPRSWCVFGCLEGLGGLEGDRC